jgi:hypothetical protein
MTNNFDLRLGMLLCIERAKCVCINFDVVIVRLILLELFKELL